MTDERTPPIGVTRPRVDYAALDRVLDDEEETEGEQMPEHVLQTLRDWINFE